MGLLNRLQILEGRARSLRPTRYHVVREEDVLAGSPELDEFARRLDTLSELKSAAASVEEQDRLRQSLLVLAKRREAWCHSEFERRYPDYIKLHWPDDAEV